MINKTIRKIEKGSMVFMTTPIKYVKAESKKRCMWWNHLGGRALLSHLAGLLSRLYQAMVKTCRTLNYGNKKRENIE